MFMRVNILNLKEQKNKEQNVIWNDRLIGEKRQGH